MDETCSIGFWLLVIVTCLSPRRVTPFLRFPSTTDAARSTITIPANPSWFIGNDVVCVVEVARGEVCVVLLIVCSEVVVLFTLLVVMVPG